MLETWTSRPRAAHDRPRSDRPFARCWPVVVLWLLWLQARSSRFSTSSCCSETAQSESKERSDSNARASRDAPSERPRSSD